MRVTLLGVRGSLPAPGQLTAGIGGHTSCVAVARDGGKPSLLIDGGSGLVRYDEIDPGPFRGTIVLGHLHWDHIIGLPFFRCGDVEGSRVRLLVPAQGMDPDDLLDRMMSPPLFPIGRGSLRGDWTLDTYDEGSFTVEGFDVLAREIPHKGGRTMGLRVTDGTGALAYLSDHSPQSLGPGPDGLGALHPAALELAAGVDLLLHDAQYTVAELHQRWDWGHSTPAYAVRLGEAAGVGKVALFHHDPPRSDEDVRALRDEVAGDASMPVVAAAELDGFTLGGPASYPMSAGQRSERQEADGTHATAEPG